jgi:hypothetical protein
MIRGFFTRQIKFMTGTPSILSSNKLSDHRFTPRLYLDLLHANNLRVPVLDSVEGVDRRVQCAFEFGDRICRSNRWPVEAGIGWLRPAFLSLGT